MKNTINTCLIGLGRIGFGKDINYQNSHYFNIKNNKNFELISVIDKNKNLKKKIPKSIIFDENPNFKNLNNIDLFVIASPNNTHYYYLKKILNNCKQNKIIFCEKPICTTSSQYRDILNLSKINNTSIYVNHTRRFDKKFILLKKFIKKQKKKFQYGRVYYYKSWLHNGVHVLDLINFLFDETFKVVKKNTSFKAFKKLRYNYILKSKKNKIIDAICVNDDYFQLFEFDFLFDKYRLILENFADNIYYQKIYKNDFNEKILKERIKLFDNSINHNPLKKAYEQINKKFKNNENSMENVNINKIKDIMLEAFK